MGKTVKVPLADAVRSGQRVANLEDGATRGATIGLNLYLNGRVVRAEEIINRDSDTGDGPYFATLWRLINEVPPNIVAVAALTGGGFAYMDSVGVWRLRKVGRQIINFAFGDATPATIWTLPHALIVTKVRVVVRVAFNGAAPALTIGTAASPALLFPASAVDLAVVGSYEFTPDVEMLLAEAIQHTITPGAGASAGIGRILIDSIPMEGI